MKLTSEAVQDTKLQSCYDNLCQNAESVVDEEISVNLLEQIYQGKITNHIHMLVM